MLSCHSRWRRPRMRAPSTGVCDCVRSVGSSSGMAPAVHWTRTAALNEVSSCERQLHHVRAPCVSPHYLHLTVCLSVPICVQASGRTVQAAAAGGTGSAVRGAGSQAQAGAGADQPAVQCAGVRSCHRQTGVGWCTTASGKVNCNLHAVAAGTSSAARLHAIYCIMLRLRWPDTLPCAAHCMWHTS